MTMLGLAEVLDDLDELVGSVAVAAGEVDELFGACDDGALFGGAGDGDAAAAAELEQSFVAEHAKGAEDGVGVDLEDGGEVFGWGRRSPGLASPSAIARRISAATCS